LFNTNIILGGMCLGVQNPMSRLNHCTSGTSTDIAAITNPNT